MKSRKIILVAALVCVPAFASAQIVIDRYNQDGDPTQPVIEKKEDTGSVDVKKGEGEEEEVSKDLTSDEVDEVRDVLLAQLQKTHTKCMKLDDILRPDSANITGSATWEVDEKGNAKFKQSTSEVGIEMFFISDKEVERLPEEQRDAARQRIQQVYNDCAKGSDAKVDVKGKIGEVSVAFTVSHSGKKTKVQVVDSGNDGGSVAIDL